MKSNERWLWVAGILIVDMLIFFFPVTAVFLAYVILTRPVWFADWVKRLYQD